MLHRKMLPTHCFCFVVMPSPVMQHMMFDDKHDFPGDRLFLTINIPLGFLFKTRGSTVEQLIETHRSVQARLVSLSPLQ